MQFQTKERIILICIIIWRLRYCILSDCDILLPSDNIEFIIIILPRDVKDLASLSVSY